MIELLLSGGLGNQMFQYACARKLQLEYNESLTINTWLYGSGIDRFRRRCTLVRSCTLARMHIPRGIKFIHQPRRLIRLIGGLSRYGRNQVYLLGRIFGVYVWRGQTFRELKLEEREETKYLYGYFTSEKYFLPHKEIISNELEFTDSLNEKNRTILAEIDSANAVCVHIRRGDYVGTKFEVCDAAYYKRAIDCMTRRVPGARFFSFQMTWDG